MSLIRREEFGSDPRLQFQKWYAQAERKGFLRWILSFFYPPAVLHQPESMTLATATPDGKPSARVVLYKGWNDQGLLFYTNYGSRKAEELAQNPAAALVFHWGFPERQVRIEGKAERLSREASCQYWATRPRGSQLSAIASKQSQPIPSYEAFLKQVQEVGSQFAGRETPCPDFWGGIVLIPERLEFWEARLNRMHERVCYVRQSAQPEHWEKFWLAP